MQNVLKIALLLISLSTQSFAAIIVEIDEKDKATVEQLIKEVEKEVDEQIEKESQ